MTYRDLNRAHERFIDGAETFAPAPPPVFSAHSLGVVLSMLLAIGAVVTLAAVLQP